MDSKGDFLAGVIIGGLVGAAMGILFAPAPGSETRAQLLDKGIELKTLATDKAKEKADAVKLASKDLLVRLRERLPKIKEVQDILDQADQEMADN